MPPQLPNRRGTRGHGCTPEQREEYLQLLAEGMTQRAAAAKVGGFDRRTFSQWAERDEEYGRRFEEARERGRGNMHDRVREEIVERAFDRDDPSSHKVLIFHASRTVPEYQEPNIRRLEISGAQGGPVQLERSVNIADVVQLANELGILHELGITESGSGGEVPAARALLPAPAE